MTKFILKGIIGGTLTAAFGLATIYGITSNYIERPTLKELNTVSKEIRFAAGPSLEMAAIRAKLLSKAIAREIKERKEL